VSPRTVQRWRADGVGEDRRAGPKQAPPNALSEQERERLLEVVNSPEFCGLSPKQIVPRLADQGEYLASESTIYRVLRQVGQLAHREPSRPRTPRPKPTQQATGPNQLWSWDITYLKTTVSGRYFYLYLMLDVWSRKIVGWTIHATESAEHASKLMQQASAGIDTQGLILHSDNGSPMKGATMLATLQWLGVVPSFSRPHVKDDNPYSESLFRTLKYRPGFPKQPFATVKAARSWIARFVSWYNEEHLHSAIRYVTPAERHNRKDGAILAKRKRVYEQARNECPSRWTGRTRNWTPVKAVFLNPQLAEAGAA